ncbi:hypothetical protein MBLNU459_g3612t1 [Dothideomycetes sp. NU459]
MARRARNPIGFTALPVTLLATLVYTALLAALLVTHHVLPSAPKTATPKQWPGVNLTAAWLDLEELSSDFHPFNSRSNLQVRDWLVGRVSDILDANHAEWSLVSENGTLRQAQSPAHAVAAAAAAPCAVTVFSDNKSNITYSEKRGVHYFEGDNIMVYIRGSEDDPQDWWLGDDRYDGPGGVLVNAHYDSVSTGFGATDDGVGVITVLQLISHFTTDGNQPKRGILALLNNGEEDGLYGAKAFTQHPLAQFPHAFLNLEGAGAGGRATLFRSTDTEVTKFYAGSKYPFGTVVSGDGFKRGFVRSGTDYSVFTQDLGMRGLDVAFMEPRARYHTEQDDARDTSRESLWHMLSAALQTVKALSHDTSSTFESSNEQSEGKVNAGNGSDGVWFDILGRVFAVIQLHTLFALSVTLLVAGPILLILVEVGLQKTGKWYLFSRKQYLHSSDDDEPVSLFGWRGFFRFPIAFVAASAAVVALAFLLTKINPLILYSSEYAVWSMMLSAWLSVAWFVLRLGDSIRPSALSRVFTLLWMYALSWVALVAVTVGENQLHLGSGYFMVIYNAAIFVALLISYLEMFALPKKSVYAEHAVFGAEAVDDGHHRAESIRSTNHVDEPPRGRDGPNSNANDNEDANERTSLLNSRQTFTRYGRDRRHSEVSDENTPLVQDPLINKAYEGEQAWSSSLPKWTWLLQFLVLGPINIILVGQIALLITSATNQTPADGNPVFLIYVLVAALSVLILLPLSPFMHRITYHVSTAIFLVFVGTLIYNLTAFPFSRESRLKIYFIQQVDLDNGSNSVALTGLDPFLHEIIGELPSAAGQSLSCDYHDWAARNELTTCVWHGLAPNVVPASYTPDPEVKYPNKTFRGTIQPRKPNPTKQHAKWLDYNVTRPGGNSSDELVFDVKGTNTRACRIYVDAPIANLTIDGAGASGQGFVPPDYLAGRNETQIRLWSRTWDAAWRVRVTVAADAAAAADKKRRTPVEGKVMCIWSDANQVGTIPALDEIKHFMPVWSTVSKGADGLVEAFTRFSV